ncbi:MAG: phage minor head protein [Panacagrimonas sp.]
MSAPAKPDEVKLPFAEQIAAVRLRTRNLIPTAKWTDVMRNAHDRGFAVAGAMKTDLLADFAGAVDRVVAEGKSIEWFRQNFDSIVEKHGWAYTGERNWRSRVIYTTNMRTSYAAGRLAQLRDPDLQKVAPFWMYRHGGSTDPRPQHLAWDRLVLPADDPWFKVHYPPNGWGCSCRVVAVSRTTAKRMGGRFEPPPPTDPKGAIDPGWDYMPGDTVADELRKFVQDKASKAPAALAAPVVRDVEPIDVRAFAERAMKTADRKITLDLGTVKNAALIREKTGFDLTGFTRQLDNYGVRHTLREHGDPKLEWKRGQIAVTLDDFSLLTTIMDFFDEVRHDGKNKVGRDVLVFSKLIDGVGYWHAAEIRDGKHLVVTDSLRKKAGSWSLE